MEHIAIEFKNKSWLYQKYIIEKRSTHEIAKEISCDNKTIYYWLKKFKISIRTRGEAHKGKYHSKEAKQKMSNSQKGKYGKKNPNWKGGEIRKGNRIYIYKPEHLYADSNGYVRRSHLVMEKILGRYLLPEEIVHHKNEMTDDDRPENLQLFNSHSSHMSFHNKKRILGEKFVKAHQEFPKETL